MTRRNSFQLFAGLLLLGGGVLALLNQLDVIDVDWDTVWSGVWPLIITVIGIVSLISNPRSYVPSPILVTIGVLLALTTLDVIDVDFWDLAWPALFIIAGIGILTAALVRSRPSGTRRINGFAFWWGGRHVSTAPDFEGGRFTAIMGGIEVDLRGAGIAPGPQGPGVATISVFTFWGGVDIRVPPNWRVEVSGVPILGGWENKAAVPFDPAAPTLRVEATCIMSGTSVRN